MGGDHAPGMVVEGVSFARKRFPNIHFLLFGDEALLKPLVDRYNLHDVCEIRHTPDKIASTDKPSQALRGGRNSSMRLAINAVRDGEAAGVVSAGNTGALMAMAKFVLKTLPGIDRPAIATFLPTERGETLMLDLGANVECSATNLVQFAIMGDAFSRIVSGIDKPSVGLLNVGEEELKGNDEVRDAAAILKGDSHNLNFHGFVEGTDVLKGTVDIVVTDGFTGNVTLKTIQGTAKLISQFLRQSFASSISAKIGYLFARPALEQLKKRMDPRRYNGAMFLGLNGIAIKSHGGTDALGFASAIGVAVNLITEGFNDRVKDEFARLEAGEEN
jgi:glycerol-3-phosphate acyltransferase PlsX